MNILQTLYCLFSYVKGVGGGFCFKEAAIFKTNLTQFFLKREKIGNCLRNWVL